MWIVLLVLLAIIAYMLAKYFWKKSDPKSVVTVKLEEIKQELTNPNIADEELQKLEKTIVLVSEFFDNAKNMGIETIEKCVADDTPLPPYWDEQVDKLRKLSDEIELLSPDMDTYTWVNDIAQSGQSYKRMFHAAQEYVTNQMPIQEPDGLKHTLHHWYQKINFTNERFDKLRELASKLPEN